MLRGMKASELLSVVATNPGEQVVAVKLPNGALVGVREVRAVALPRRTGRANDPTDYLLVLELEQGTRSG